MSSDTFSKFDGYPIELYDGRFSGTFEMDEESGEGIKYEQSVCFLVVAHASKAAISTNKDGDVKRTNTFAVQRVEVISPEKAEELIATQQEFEVSPEIFSDETISSDTSGVLHHITSTPVMPEEEDVFRPGEDFDPETGEVFTPSAEPSLTPPDPGSTREALDSFLYGEA